MTTAEEIAHSLGISGKTLRRRLREWFPNHEKHTPWIFSHEEADAVKRRWRGSGNLASPPSPLSDSPARSIRPPTSRGTSDEHYVVDLCDVLLNESASRQHRFSWLVGDPGTNGARRSLPVDAYYATRRLVVEYRERQHTEATPFFDKPDRMTVSGVHRGQQRRLYDQRRNDEIPSHGLRLVIVSYSDLAADSKGRLRRDRAYDVKALEALLA